MLAGQPLVAFVTVADRDRAREFYEQTLGLTLVEDTAFALVFDAAGTTLRVAIGPDAVAPTTPCSVGRSLMPAPPWPTSPAEASS